MKIHLPLTELICILLIGQVASKLSESRGLSCKEQAQKAINSNLVGTFVPKCSSDGHFAPLQCYGSIGVCFCVNKHGEKVPDAMIPGTKCNNPCFKRVLGNQPPAILVHGAPQTISMGIPAPDCDENGFFNPRQCDSSSCWCVDKNGNEFEHTRGNSNDIVCK